VGELTRAGISIESDLLGRFDRFIAKAGYENRSEALRDLLRERLASAELFDSGSNVLGVITLVYDNRIRSLTCKLTAIERQNQEIVLSKVHSRLNHESCVEVIILRGLAWKVEACAVRLVGMKRLRFGKFTIGLAESTIPDTDLASD
jgi:CopG family transcriptional regulator, nickel-responsive regulator